jgi:hypothetical protein
MGTLGRHKRRRRNTHQHGCNNISGQHGGDDPTLKEDGDSSFLDASFALQTSSPNSSLTQATQQQEAQERTEIPVKKAAGHPTFSPPQKPPNKKAMNAAPQRKSLVSSTEQQKVLAEFTEEELFGFLAFLRRRDNNKTHSTNETTEPTTNEPTAAEEPSLHYNNQYIDFEKLSEFTLDFDSFSYKINEFGRKTKRDSREAIRQAESRATKKIVTAIMDAGDDDQQRALALHRSLVDERTREIAKSAGFKSSRMEAISFHWDQLKKLVEAGSSKTGKANLDQSLVIDSILAAIAGDLVQNANGTTTVDKSAPSLSATLSLLGLNAKSGRTRLKRAILTRKALKVSKGLSRNAKWLTILKRQWRGHRKITPAVKDAIVDWVTKHENVVTSPIYNETLLVKRPGSGEKHRVPKLLLEIPVRELHNLLVAPIDQGGLSQSRDSEGKIVVSDTTLRRIIRKDLPQL